MKIIEVMLFNQDAEEKIKRDMPYKAWCFFNSKQMSLSGDQISLTPGGDYSSLEDAREATNWLVSQLGGSVKWAADHTPKKETKK